MRSMAQRINQIGRVGPTESETAEQRIDVMAIATQLAREAAVRLLRAGSTTPAPGTGEEQIEEVRGSLSPTNQFPGAFPMRIARAA